MTTPQDIPPGMSEAAWDAAIASAIDEEREACLSIATDVMETAYSVAETMKEGGFEQEHEDARGAAFIAHIIASSIRKRGGK